MEQNTNRLLWAASLLALGALLIGGGIVLAQENFLPKISQAFVKMIDGKEPGYSEEEKEIQDLINDGFIPVATADELNNVRSATVETYGEGTKWEGKYLGGYDKKYIQVANIDLSGHSDGEGWTPIGNDYSSRFRGLFNGNRYKITGLTINRPETDYVGLFGYTSGATISDVGLIDNNVTGSHEVGGLVGRTEGGTTISNSYTTGSVTGSGYNVGGLVGYAGYSTISKSYTTGSVDGSSWVGGLVGKTDYSTTINNSYATGEVTGTGTGSATDTGDNVGGLVGWASSSSIENSYAEGSVTSSGDGLGGLVGYASGSTIENSYWDKETTGKTTSAGGGIGKTTEEMKLKETYEGWSFDTVWEITPGNYPTLR